MMQTIHIVGRVGTGTKNMEFRMEVLPKIVEKVTSKVM